MNTSGCVGHRRENTLRRKFLLSTCLGLAVVVAQPVSAEQVEPQVIITAKPLSAALRQLSDESDLQIAFSDADTDGLHSPAVTGPATPENALEQMLEGSGLAAYYVSDQTIAVTRAGTPDTTDVSQLGKIIVWGTQDPEHYDENSTYELPASVVYQDSDDIQQSRGMSVGDFLKGHAGILNGENRNSGALDVNVRGMQGQSRVPVVIDGSFQETTAYRGYSGVAGRTYLDPDLIGSMSIEKGPSAAADAAGAVGGIMRVSTLKPDDVIEEGEVAGARVTLGLTGNTTAPATTLTYGGRGDPSAFDDPGTFELGESKNGSIALARKFGNFEVLGAWSRRQTGNYFAGTNGSGPEDGSLNVYGLGEEVLNTSQDTTSLLLRGIYSWGNNHSLDVSYMNYDSEYGEAMPSQIIRFDSVWQNPLSDVNVDTLTARYRWNPDDNDLIDLKVDVFNTTTTAALRQVLDAGFPVPGTTVLIEQIYLNEVEQTGINASNTSRFDIAGRPLNLSYGLSFKREDIGQPDDPESYANGILNPGPTDIVIGGANLFSSIDEADARDGWRKETSAFVSAEYQPTDRLTLNGALRYTYMEAQDNDPAGSSDPVHRTASGTTPILSALYEVQPGLQFYVKYAEAMRMPSLFESTSGWSAAPLSTTDLRPEHAKTTEIGVNFQRDNMFGREGLFQAKMSYFDQNVDDYITRNLSGNNFVNIDSARLRGWEISLNMESGRIFGDLSFAKYIETEYCDEDGSCSGGGTQGGYSHLHVPPETSASLTLGARFFDEKLTLGARATYIGERASIDYADLDGGVSRAVNWDPYTTIDLFGSYDINDRVKVDFAIDNLTDEYYLDSLALGLMPAPGRTVRLNLTATF